jgi:multidrug efflux pump
LRLSEISIERPVLASVMSLVIVLFGALALARLPNRELPDVDEPVVAVTTVYPGAAPEVVETSVTEPLEDQLIGIEGVRHLVSQSREQASTITVQFEIDRDIEAAANDVRDRVARSRQALPDEVEDPIVAKRDSDANAVMWLAVSGEGYDQIQISRIVESRIKDRISKLPGVSDVLVGGERRYAMRVWIHNDRLVAHDLAISDVAEALRRENVDIPSGRVEGVDREYTVRSLGELRTVEGYEGLIVATRGGEAIRLRDVARVEVGPEDERKLVRFNQRPAVGLGIIKQSQANTLDVADAVHAVLPAVRAELPPGVRLEVAYDGAKFIRESIRDVRRTIFEAIALVVLVIYLFLRSFRATVIPAIAIPVSIVGAFGLLYFLGYTINTLTLMGVTLAIGLVVDDAIVVLENVMRWVEAGRPPREAAREGMAEISFAVIAATVSSVAVFLPLAFLRDTTGRLFAEFAVTVAAAIFISGFVALTLSPALCALVLRERRAEGAVKARLAAAIARLGTGYAAALQPVLRRPGLWLALGIAWVALGVVWFTRMPEELMPSDDRDTLLVYNQAPEGATIEYTDRYQRMAERAVTAVPEVSRVFSIVSLGLGTPGLVNEGFLWVSLAPRAERERSQAEVIEGVRGPLSEIPGIESFAFGPSPLRGFRGTPVELALQGPEIADLKRYSDAIADRLRATPGFVNVRTDLFLNKPQLEVVIDRERASDLGVSVREIATTLQILLGGVDISTFKLEGETYNVMAQLPRAERSRPADLLSLYVRGKDDQLVSLRSVVKAAETVAPRSLNHFDRRRSATINSDLGDGFSQGEALAVASRVAEEVLAGASGYGYVFSGEAEKFFESGNALLFAYALAVLVVYLVLAGQFESFVHPLTILVGVALSFTGALVALSAAGHTLNLYSKIGLVMLVGLVAKNSILIVEFANQLRERGLPLGAAIFEASRTRFRPILMTALATVMGILPIALGSGAGGEARAPLGVAVVGGMVFSTALTFFVVPATYLAVESLRERLAEARAARGAGRPAPASSPFGGGA